MRFCVGELSDKETFFLAELAFMLKSFKVRLVSKYCRRVERHIIFYNWLKYAKLTQCASRVVRYIIAYELFCTFIG